MTALIIMGAVVTLLRSYANYLEMLSFVVSNFSIASSEQELVAKLLTIMIQIILLYSLGCCYWFLQCFTNDHPNPFFPVYCAAFPLSIAIACTYFL